MELSVEQEHEERKIGLSFLLMISRVFFGSIDHGLAETFDCFTVQRLVRCRCCHLNAWFLPKRGKVFTSEVVLSAGQYSGLDFKAA